MILITWSWILMVFYVSLMLVIGYVASKKISQGDDFTIPWASCGPYFLALAFAASTASGATFLGAPALSCEWATATIGVYFGGVICIQLIMRDVCH